MRLLIFAVELSRKKKILSFVCIGFICSELLFFGSFSKSIGPELAGFNYAQPKEEKIFDILKSDKTIFRICPFGAQRDLPLWLWPSMNLNYGLDSAAIYSPLVNRDYFLATKGLGIVDDSLGIVPPVTEQLYKKLSMLKKMNVKYIVSTMRLENSVLNLLTQDKKLFLYELVEVHPSGRC